MTYDIVLDVECPRCGDIELGTDQVWLVVASVASRSHYAFHCPSCATHVSRHAAEDAVDLLAPLVAVWHLDVPAEALEHRCGPPLTMDDLLDLCLALDRADDLGRPDSLAA